MPGNSCLFMEYWHQRADDRHSSPPQGKRELFVVKDKSMKCDIFPFSALTLLVEWKEGHPACKKMGVGLLVAMIWLELCAAYNSNCHHRFHHPLLQRTPANPGSPGKWPLKRRERNYVRNNFCSSTTPPPLAKMLMCDLFVVANLLVETV